MTQLPSRLGVIPIRGVVFLPNSRVAFKVGREMSMEALSYSLSSTKQIAGFTQVDPAMENPTMDDLYPIGTLCNVLQQEKKDETVQFVVVDALTRIRVSKLFQSSPCIVIEPTKVSEALSADEIIVPPTKDIERAADLLMKYAPENDPLHSMIRPLPYGNEPGKLADYLVLRSKTTFQNQVACLLELNPHKRLKLAYKIMVEEGQQAQLESEINDKVTTAIRAEHRGIFLRGQLKAVLEELGEDAPLSLYNPIFRGRNFRLDPKLTFVLMPFADQFRPIYDEIIKPVVERFDSTCVRADDLHGSKPIMEDIWRLINEAKIVIADVTDKNANVFYEVGLAHAIGKEVIIISQVIDDVPFDLRHLRCFIYQDSVAGFRRLESQLMKALSTIDGLTLVKSEN